MSIFYRSLVHRFPAPTFFLISRFVSSSVSRVVGSSTAKVSLGALVSEINSCIEAAESSSQNISWSSPPLLNPKLVGDVTAPIGSRQLAPSSLKSLERALKLWADVQCLPIPRSLLGGPASLAVRAYGLLGAHRVALSLFRGLQRRSRELGVAEGGELVWDARGLHSLLRSARLVGDSSMYLEVLGILESGEGGFVEKLNSESNSSGLPRECDSLTLTHSFVAEEASRLEGLLEAIIRGDCESFKAGSVLTSLSGISWPPSRGLYLLLAKVALAKGNMNDAAKAVVELVRAHKAQYVAITEFARLKSVENSITSLDDVFGHHLTQPSQSVSPVCFLRNPTYSEYPVSKEVFHEEMNTTADIFCGALREGYPSAALAAYLSLRYLFLTSAGYLQHTESLVGESSEMSSMLHEDAHRTLSSFLSSHVDLPWALKQSAKLGCNALTEAIAVDMYYLSTSPDNLPRNLLCFMAQSSAISGEDPLGALRALALDELMGSNPSSPVLGVAVKEVTRELRRLITHFLTWEKKLFSSSSGDVGEEEVVSEVLAVENDQTATTEGWNEDAGEKEVSSLNRSFPAGTTTSMGESIEEGKGGNDKGIDFLEKGDNGGLGSVDYSTSTPLPPLLTPFYDSLAALLRLPVSHYHSHSAQPVSRDVIELSGLVSGYTAESFLIRLLCLASLQAWQLSGKPGGGQVDGNIWHSLLKASVHSATLAVTTAPPCAPTGVEGLLNPKSFSFTEYLANNGAGRAADPLPLGNLRIMEVFQQSLKATSGSFLSSIGGLVNNGTDGSFGERGRDIAPVCPMALHTVLSALTTNPRLRSQTIRVFEVATRFGVTPHPDSYGAVIESIVTFATLETRKKVQSVMQALDGGGTPLRASRSNPVDMPSILNFTQNLIDRKLVPTPRVFDALSNACIRSGAAAKAAAVLRYSISVGGTPPASAFHRLLREVLAMHYEGLAPLRPPLDQFPESSLSQNQVSSDGFTLMELLRSDNAPPISVQEVVILLSSAGHSVPEQLQILVHEYEKKSK